MATSSRSRLYNNTLSIYRVSPFYTTETSQFDNRLLAQHALKFQEILMGKFVCGVRIDGPAENDVLLRAGPLRGVTWTILENDSVFDLEEKDDDEDEGLLADNAKRREVVFTVSYERIEYRAIFLESIHLSHSKTDREKEEFHYFPLLLMKMPTSLRKAFTEYLTTTFDTRISLLYLSKNHLKDCFEKYITDISSDQLDTDNDAIQLNPDWENVIKDTVIRLGFDLPYETSSLKAVDVLIPRDDFSKIMSMGEKVDVTFFEAIGTYLKSHLALDLWHPMVHVTRISCAAFNLDVNGRIKLTQPANLKTNNLQVQANKRLINTLIKAATGPLTLKQDSSEQTLD